MARTAVLHKEHTNYRCLSYYFNNKSRQEIHLQRVVRSSVRS
jgi:hypothetical protein